MADVIEFMSKANLEATFYKITASAVRFSVKKLNGIGAAVILSATPDVQNAYWIVIGLDNNCIIYKNGENFTSKQTQEVLLTRDEYKEFWVAWNNGTIRMGHGNMTKPFITRNIIERNLVYVAFVASTWESRLLWKILLPPQIDKPIVTQLSGGEPRWVHAEDQLPDDAIIGGYENEILYIMRARHANSLTPGKFVPSEGVGYLAWGGGTHEKNDIEVLCGYNYEWVPTKSDEIPFGAVVAGHSEDIRQENLYVGRAKVGHNVIPGKVQPSHKVCYVPYNRRENGNTDYEILVVPHSNTHNEHGYYISNYNLPGSEYDMYDEDE